MNTEEIKNTFEKMNEKELDELLSDMPCEKLDDAEAERIAESALRKTAAE